MRDAMADLDEISLMLGDIRASLRHGTERFERKEKLDKEWYTDIVRRLDDLADLKPRIESVEGALTPLARHVEEQKIREYKLAGALVVIGGVVSLIGTVLFTLGGKVMNALYG
jgi:hypothetical protein